MPIRLPADSQPPVQRLPDLKAWLEKKSHFLFGPRQTGKTFLIRQTLPGARVYDLLDSAVFLALSRRPSLLAEEIGPGQKVVVIDEVQRLPILLNEVHRLIESRGIRFLLTGSSARTLRRTIAEAGISSSRRRVSPRPLATGPKRSRSMP